MTLLKANPLTAWPARFRPERSTLLMAASALLGGALALGHEFTFGVVLIDDTAFYTAAARSLLAGEGFLGMDGYPLAWFPPLYSLLLAVASLGIFDPIAVAGPLNAVIFGLTAFVVGRYLQRRLESRFLVAWGCLATALAPPLIELSRLGMSDPLFILLATLSLVQTDRFLAEGRRRTLVWVTVFSALAWLTRYIGVVVPAFVGLLLLFHPSAADSMGQRVRRVTAYSLIVATPMCLWLLRNYLDSGALTPHLPPTDYPLSMMLWDSVRILGSWVLPPMCHLPGLLLFDGAVLALLSLTAAGLALVGCLFVTHNGGRRPVVCWRPLWLFGGFALTYLVLFIAVISLLARIYMADGVQMRLLTPLYIPLLVAGVFALDRVLSYERERRLSGSIGSLPLVRTMMPGREGSALTAIVTIVLSLVVVRQVVLAASTMIFGNCSYHYYFNGPRWVGSETLRYVRENPIVGTLYSNKPPALYFYADGKSMNRYRYTWWSRAAQETWFERIIRDDGAAYVVWFYMEGGDSRDYGAPDLRLLSGLEPVAELADGAVFRFNEDYAPRTDPYRSAYESVLSGDYGEAVARSTFEVYLDDTTVFYLKEPCAEEDVKGRFHVRYFTRRQLHRSFDELRFGFRDRGILWEGKCLASLALPDHEITRIETGQIRPDGVVAWEAHIQVPSVPEPARSGLIDLAR